ncbi:hypothetical protein FRB91_005624 [Serendipita sp. 411]|nr:hypothetical protein FRB91_005624 [Serendipita sp. 411]
MYDPSKYQNLYKRATRTLSIRDPNGAAHTYKITNKDTSGKSGSIYDVEGQPSRLVKGPVSWLEAMITEAYEPTTIIGTRPTGAAAAGSSTGTGTREGDSRESFNRELTKIAQTVQTPGWSPAFTTKVYGPVLHKTWWMDMPLVGQPIRTLRPVEAASAEGPNKAAQVAACKTYMGDHIVPAVRAALDEWHVEVHAKLHQWFTFTDIKVSHFRWMHIEGQPPRARMIDAGSARVSISNEKPTETINASLWLSVCDGLNLSNTPSEKAASTKAASEKVGGFPTPPGGNEPAPNPATPAPASKHSYPPQVVAGGVPSHAGTNVAGTGETISTQPERQPSPQMRTASTGRSSGSDSSGCKCFGINCKCLT